MSVISGDTFKACHFQQSPHNQSLGRSTGEKHRHQRGTDNDVPDLSLSLVHLQIPINLITPLLILRPHPNPINTSLGSGYPFPQYQNRVVETSKPPQQASNHHAF